MLKYINQDITTVELGIVAHGVNCQHAMNSGVAKAIREKWPIVYEKYMEQPYGKTMLGTAHLIAIYENDSLFVANCYTQVFYGRGGRFAGPQAIRQSLGQVCKMADFYDLPVYIPKIGCGLGGLDWESEVEPIVQSLADRYERINIFVCEV